MGKGRFNVKLVSDCIFFFGTVYYMDCLYTILNGLCHIHKLAGSREERRDGKKGQMIWLQNSGY